MGYKAALHLHTSDDPEEVIAYSTFQAIDRAKELGFSILAITCHNKVTDIKQYETYAKAAGILLIQAIELSIDTQHVLILNCNKKAEYITSFAELKKYKSKNPNCFVIAPHPYFYLKECLMSNLDKHITIFDGIEYNYFYHKYFNPNKKAYQTAQKHNKPLIGTSDIHFLEYFDQTYTLIKADKLEINSILKALKENQLEIITKSFSILELIKVLFKMLKLSEKKCSSRTKIHF